MAKVILMLLMVVVLMHQNGCEKIERLWEADKFACNFSKLGPGFRATESEFTDCLWTKAGILYPNGTFNRAGVPKYLTREFVHLPNYPKIRDGFNNCVDRAFEGEESKGLYECLKNEGILELMNQRKT